MRITSLRLPDEVRQKLLALSALETVRLGKRISMSEIVRRAVNAMVVSPAGCPEQREVRV
jgi:hypothetical protein